ncbi:hypothetical protein HKX48_008464 [Thoreauomyces humboldtii]|nr:hypothetical protein HKX48_008464 [Thoreauomyces humboldtii]
MAAASDAESRQASHILLRKFGTKLMKAQIKCRAISLRGDPRDEIVHKCIDIDPVMLVVGSRGMTGLKRVFVGSTSDHLVHHSPCPVVVVHRHHRPADEQEHHRRHLFHRDRDDTDKQKQKEEKEQQEAPVSA